MTRRNVPCRWLIRGARAGVALGAAGAHRMAFAHSVRDCPGVCPGVVVPPGHRAQDVGLRRRGNASKGI
eukprot:scaffold27349_cov45-Phaeocystis_antarctica.AAC.2